MWEFGLSAPVFVWTYSVFEDYYASEAVSPSMYKFMAEYVRNNFIDTDYDGTSYKPGGIEAEAYEMYFALSLDRRIELHQDRVNELVELLREEEQWRGGHEYGAEDRLGGPSYNHYEEF